MVKNNRGSAFVESIVVIPVLLLLIGGLVDISRWFNMNMAISRIAYEGARYGASLPSMPFEPPPSNVMADGYGEGNVNQVSEGVKGQLITRIEDLIEMRGLEDTALPPRVMRTKFDGQSEDVIWVEVSMQFKPFFLSKAFYSSSVSAVAQAPYLYR